MASVKRPRRAQRFLAIVLVVAILGGGIIADRVGVGSRENAYDGSEAYAYLVETMENLSYGWLQQLSFGLQARLSDAQSADGCWRRACVAVAGEDFSEASEWLQDCVALQEDASSADAAELYLQLACIRSLSKDAPGAVEAAARAAELDAQSVRIQQMLYQFSLDAGDSGRAAAALESLSQLSEDTTHYEEIADLYLDAGNYTQAGHYYDLAVSCYGGNHRLYYMRGTCWMLLGKYGEAIEDFSNSQMPGSLYSQGICEMALNDYRDAARCFEDSIERGEQANDARMMLAVCRLETGDYASAEELFQQYLNAGGQYADVAYYLGTALAMQGKYQEAIEHFEASVDAGGYAQESLFALAQCRYFLGDYSGAIEGFEQCVEQDIRSAESWYYLGLSLAAMGENVRAEEALNRALDAGLKDE